MENGTKRPRRPVRAKASGTWKKQQLEQQLQELKQENESLSEQKKLLEDDKHIEGVAREELGLVKPGEVPYVR